MRIKKDYRLITKIEIIEVSDEKEPANASEADEQIVKDKEAERIPKYIKPDSYIIVLAIDGKQLSSENLAEEIHQLVLQGKNYSNYW